MPPHTRPGPLQAYDLRMFIPDPGSSGTPSVRSRPNKRPYSPGPGALDSPAKRRLKAAEGIPAPKYAMSPLSGSTNSARFAPAHFNALLQGPDSPAKRLDFGSSETSELTACETPLRSGGVGSATPRRRSPKRTPAARVRRSPRLAAQKSLSCSTSANLTSPSPGYTDADRDARASAAAVRSFITAPVLIPRVVTPPDRQSAHYPGFDIYQDPYTVLPMASSASSSFDGSPPDVSGSAKGQDKENLPLKRKSSKKTSTPTHTTSSDVVRLKAGIVSPSAKSSVKKPVPASPHPKHVHDYLATPKERILRPSVSPAATLVGVTPGRTVLGKEERRQMRRAMEEEVDEIDGEDEVLV